MKPNELGDFIAGALGPLAIIWLILGFWQQGDELRSSVEALQLQSEELRNSVEQQKALVAVSRQQVEADIRAQNEERENRRILAQPKIVLSSEGGSTKLAKIKVRNIGASCSGLVINVVDGDYTNSIFSIGSLGNGESALAHLKLEDSQFLDFYFEISYTDKFGGSGKQKVEAHRKSIRHAGFQLGQSSLD